MTAQLDQRNFVIPDMKVGDNVRGRAPGIALKMMAGGSSSSKRI